MPARPRCLFCKLVPAFSAFIFPKLSVEFRQRGKKLSGPKAGTEMGKVRCIGVKSLKRNANEFIVNY